MRRHYRSKRVDSKQNSSVLSAEDKIIQLTSRDAWKALVFAFRRDFQKPIAAYDFIKGLDGRPFPEWLNAEELRRSVARDLISDFRRDFFDNPSFPREFCSQTEMMDYLIAAGACDEAIQAAPQVWRRYLKCRRPSGDDEAKQNPNTDHSAQLTVAKKKPRLKGQGLRLC